MKIPRRVPWRRPSSSLALPVLGLVRDFTFSYVYRIASGLRCAFSCCNIECGSSVLRALSLDSRSRGLATAVH